jgi:hypothetical protein
MPIVRSSMVTVTVPSGEDAVSLPLRPGRIAFASERRQRDEIGLAVAGSGDRVAVRARGRVLEHAVDGRLDVVGEHVLPLAGLRMGLGPAQAEDVGEEALGEPVTAHDPLGQREAGLGQRDAVGDGDEALGRHPPDHLGHGRA